jgi:ligand-binding sensor domain-containing protein/signal transduction histidine kinase/AraC-like DNA-binding protein
MASVYRAGVVLAILLNLCPCSLVNGQSVSFNFDHLTVEEGLSQSSVYAITQDAEGFVWLGTRDGLNRYDSRKLTVYRYQADNDKSLSDNTINSLLSDSEGTLWIGTRHGLNKYQPRSDDFIRLYPEPEDKNKPHLSNNVITCLLEDQHKNLWVGTRQGLRLLIAKDPLRSLHFQHASQLPNSLVNNDVRALFQDREGSIWIGTSQGLSKLTFTQARKYQFTTYYLEKSDSLYQSNNNWVNAIAEDAEGNLWIGTEKSGLKLLNKKTGQIHSLTRNSTWDLNSKSVRTISRDKQGDFWVGTMDGLYVINPRENKWIELKNNSDDLTSLTDNSVRSVCIDRQGSYWVGTYYGGVNFYSPLSKQFQRVESEDRQARFSFKIISALTTDHENNLWVSTDGHGLYLMDRERKHVKRYKHNGSDKNSLSSNKIKCLLLEENQGLWIGTMQGLNYFDFKRKQFIHYFHEPGNEQSLPDDRIYDLKKDRRGDLWIATSRGGLCRYDRTKNAFERLNHHPEDPTSVSSNGITYLLEDSSQNLWVGTMAGLNKKQPGTHTFTRFASHPSDTNSLSGGHILCLYEDRQQRLWIGTRGNGLNLFLPQSNRFKRLNVQQGLSGRNVYGIVEDSKGALWISTENGLSKLDPVSFTFKNYDKDDGLACKEFNTNSFHQDKQGRIYFGGYNGIVSFHPDSIRENNTAPKLLFTQLRLFNKEVKINSDTEFLSQSLNKTASLTFDHTQNVFSVEFAALNFINSPNNRYAYKLEGFEEQWNWVKEPVATYMNLRPGNYTLLVKGSNNNGVWNESPLALPIKVLPPPWKSWWAYTIYCTLFLGVLYAWNRFNRKQLKLAHDLELEHLDKERQRDLHQTKLNFFANIAHEIRTPLTLIVSPVDLLSHQYPADPFLQRQLMMVKSNTNRLLRLLNQLLDFNKHETGSIQLKLADGNIVQLIEKIRFSFEEYARSRNITLDFHSDWEKIRLRYDQEELEKVFYNLLSNAFKFTPGGGQVSIRVTREEQKISVSGDCSAPKHPSESFYVKVTIEDNGIGISPPDLEKIFHRFYQAENTGIHEAGFGIGLALTKGIIELHGGSIAVESGEAIEDQPGFTRFTILLPGTDQELKANHPQAVTDTVTQLNQTPYVAPAPTEELADDPVEMTTHEKPSILLVEDNVEIRKYLRSVLLPYYEVTEASDGEEAWSIATRKLPELVISDVAMPTMNGLELTTRLKTNESTCHIPVILLTARGSFIHQMEGLGTGADEYISKPFDIQLLLLKVKNHLAIREKLKAKYKRMVTLQPHYEAVNNPDDKFLHRLTSILEANLSDADFCVAKLVSEMGMSRPVLFRKVKMLTDLSVIDLIRSMRLKKAEMLLKQKRLTIAEVAFSVGFNDPKYFSRSFRNQFGKTPSEYVHELN